MVDYPRAKLLRDLEQEFVPDYDPRTCPQPTNGQRMRSNTSPSASDALNKA
jgi:hypothetical protein